MPRLRVKFGLAFFGSQRTPQRLRKWGSTRLMNGELEVVAGFGNKMRATRTRVLPDSTLTKMHKGTAGPGTATTQHGKGSKPRGRERERRRRQSGVDQVANVG